ncbi:MAG: hypothetical protein EG824_14015 [Deltaproteobacteria bacterium]|nr:hypothetical protein [Deltaproteobacteria bacterium]
MYEDKLATEAGRKTLRPSAMARNFLLQRYTPGDVREMIALLETETLNAGFQIVEIPTHLKELTSAEEALTKRLIDPVTRDELEPRVIHDVDCIAGILTLRRGSRSNRLEKVKSIFVTSSTLVIRNTRLWWEEDEHEIGIPPAIHMRALANIAWLKKPTIRREYKLRELVALCRAALRPMPETWRRFLKHLDVLRKSNRINSDEEVAIVVSAMSDRLLVEAEMEERQHGDIDAITLDEIVERVKGSYKDQAYEKEQQLIHEYENRLADIEKGRNEISEKLRARDNLNEGRARRWSRRFSWFLFVLVVAIPIAGAYFLVCEHPFKNTLPSMLVGICITLFTLLELSGIVDHLYKWRSLVEVKLTISIRSWLQGDK